MRVSLKFEKLSGTDIELESQGCMVRKYGIVSDICLLLSIDYRNIQILHIVKHTAVVTT